MHILFPQSPLMRKLPEPLFEAEYDAATSLGFACHLIDEDALSAGNTADALKRLPQGAGVPALYRGWILTEERYRSFGHGLSERGYALVSSADDYAEVNYFPNYYPKIRDCSPAAVWTDSPDVFSAWSASRKLGDGPFVIKDHVKSAKHQWHDACFIAKGAGREQFEHVAENLKNEQGPSFQRGFVVKQFVPLRSRGEGLREYPQCEEYRLIFWRRQLLAASHYHRLSEESADWSRFIEVAQRFRAPFFTMDVALTEAGDWIIVDMGAGEVSSLPPNLAPERFYRELRERIAASSFIENEEFPRI
jgi:hypothetical protein